jgi:hypothetical protein
MCARDVAEYLSVSVATVRRMDERGELPGKVTKIRGKNGKVLPRWDKNALDRYLDEIAGDGYGDPDEVLIKLRELRG